MTEVERRELRAAVSRKRGEKALADKRAEERLKFERDFELVRAADLVAGDFVASTEEYRVVGPRGGRKRYRAERFDARISSAGPRGIAFEGEVTYAGEPLAYWRLPADLPVWRKRRAA